MSMAIPMWYFYGCIFSICLDTISTVTVHCINHKVLKEYREINDTGLIGRLVGYLGNCGIILLASLLSWVEVICWIYYHLYKKEMFKKRTREELGLAAYDRYNEKCEQY